MTPNQRSLNVQAKNKILTLWQEEAIADPVEGQLKAAPVTTASKNKVSSTAASNLNIEPTDLKEVVEEQLKIVKTIKDNFKSRADSVNASTISSNLSLSSGSSLNNILSNFIPYTTDAQSNLFKIAFSSAGEMKSLDASQYIFRLTSFTPPERKIKTLSLPYLNTNLKTVSSSGEVTHEQTFNFRIDENYYMWKELKQVLGITASGIFEPEKISNSVFDITVTAYKPGTSALEPFVETYKWTYSDCHIVSLGSVTYSYSNASNLTQNISIIYTTLEEKNLL